MSDHLPSAETVGAARAPGAWRRRYGLASEQRTPAVSSPEETLSRLETARDRLKSLVETKEESNRDLALLALESQLAAAAQQNGQPLTKEKIDEIRRLFRIVSSTRQDLATRSSLFNKDAVDRHNRNITLTDHILGTQLTSTQCSVKQLTKENDCLKKWTVVVQPVRDHPEIQIHQTYETVESPADRGKLGPIRPLRLHVDGLVGEAGLQAALEYCEENTEIQLFTRLMRDYVPRWRRAQQLVATALKQYYSSNNNNNSANNVAINSTTNISRSNSLQAVFTNSAGERLVTFVFLISFDKNTLGWREGWEAELSEVGEKAATSCHLPEEILSDGTYPAWTPDYALETLAKVAQLESVSVLPTPVSSGKVRVPKRKL